MPSKEVTKYVAGLESIHRDGEWVDVVQVVGATFIEGSMTFRLKKEDSKEYRAASKYLRFSSFTKSDNRHMGMIHDTPRAALLHLYYMLKKKVNDAKAALTYAMAAERLVTGELLKNA